MMFSFVSSFRVLLISSLRVSVTSAAISLFFEGRDCPTKRDAKKHFSRFYRDRNDCSVFMVRYLLFTVHRFPFTLYSLLFTIYHLLFTLLLQLRFFTPMGSEKAFFQNIRRIHKLLSRIQVHLLKNKI